MDDTKGRHWDPNPMKSQSQSQIFGIGIGIDFLNFEIGMGSFKNFSVLKNNLSGQKL